MTNSILPIKFYISFAVVVLMGLAIFLWFQTPQMFVYFNQAFCAH